MRYGEAEPGQLLMTIENHHVDPVATWPREDDHGKYARRHYYENDLGEQWVASVTPDLIVLTGGDIGWDTVRIGNGHGRIKITKKRKGVVMPGTVVVMMPGKKDGFIFSPDEGLWLLTLQQQQARMREMRDMLEGG